MAIQALTGPQVVFGQGPGGNDYNGERGSSMYDRWIGLLDPRAMFSYAPGQAIGNPTCGWFSGGSFVTVDCVLATLAVANIAASQSPAAGAIALVSVTGAGITAGVTITNAATGLAVTGLLGVGDAGTRQLMGDGQTIQIWDPTKSPGRNIRITSGGVDTGITFTVNGYDVYGQPMTETITGSSSSVASGVKAFKFISSITHTGSVASTMSIGTGDVIGLPLRCDSFGYLHIMVNNARVTASTGFTAAVTTDPATAITGDTRGTYALQVASNSALRQTILQNVSPANVVSTTGLLGVTQF